MNTQSKLFITFGFIVAIFGCQPVDSGPKSSNKQAKDPVVIEVPKKSIFREVPTTKGELDSKIIGNKYSEIITGIKTLRKINDPNIALIYDKIDEVIQNSEISVADLFTIEQMITKNIKDAEMASDLATQQNLKVEFIKDYNEVKSPNYRPDE